jgi:hypothetical protein
MHSSMAVLVGFLLFFVCFGLTYLLRRITGYKQHEMYKWCMDRCDWYMFIIAILLGIVTTTILCNKRSRLPMRRQDASDFDLLTSRILLSQEAVLNRTPPGANPYVSISINSSDVQTSSGSSPAVSTYYNSLDIDTLKNFIRENPSSPELIIQAQPIQQPIQLTQSSESLVFDTADLISGNAQQRR